MSDEDTKEGRGELESSGAVMPLDDRDLRYVPAGGEFLRGAFWVALRITAHEKMHLKAAKAYEAKTKHERARREAEEEYRALQCAIDRGKDIQTILDMEAEKRQQEKEEAEAEREIAALRAKLDKLRLEVKIEEVERKRRNQNEDDEFEEERQKIRTMINRPKTLWDEYYKHEAELIKERRGRDKLTPEDEDNLQRAKGYVDALLDEEAI